MNDHDSIKLDFVEQYPIIVNNFYIVSFEWRGMRRDNDNIFLFNTILKSENINVVPKLKDTDYIIVNTDGHQPEKHYYNITYISYVVNNKGELYDFRR
jgi:hypothetical protein